MKKNFQRLFAALVFIFFLCSQIRCVPVKGYQKVYLNDQEMQLTNRPAESFESDFQSYREGAVGGTNGNTGGGCGCN